MTDPFLGPKLKIKRAEAHIKELHRAHKVYRESNPYEVFTETDLNAGQLVYKLRILKPIPQEFSTIIGDVIQNLRAALDHTACCLAIQKNPTVNINDVSFPIARDIQEFNSRAKKTIRKLAPEAIAFIKALKPYKGGNDKFWQLHRLGVRDRHRLLLPTWAGRGRVAVKPILANPQTGEEIEFPYFWIVPKDRFEPLEDGTDVFRTPIPDGDRAIDDTIKVEIDVAFGDGEVVIAEPIDQTLLQLRDLVEGVITSVEKRFFT